MSAAKPKKHSHTVSASSPALPLNQLCGRAPGGTPAFSNHDVENFSGVQNHYGSFFTGYQWQCVEFARRWLWDRKGLLLPDINVAGEIFFVPHVFDETMKPAAVLSVKNGSSTAPPAPDSLIIHKCSWNNFPGHVGVITEVLPDRVRIADQNRVFHLWPAVSGDCEDPAKGSYSLELPLKKDPKTGCYEIVDTEEPVLGWVEFPGRPNVAPPTSMPEIPANLGREAFAPLTHPLPSTVTGTPTLDKKARRHTFWSAMANFHPTPYLFPLVIARIIGLLLYYKLALPAWRKVFGTSSKSDKK